MLYKNPKFRLGIDSEQLVVRLFHQHGLLVNLSTLKLNPYLEKPSLEAVLRELQKRNL
jgi:hypothetical protein